MLDTKDRVVMVSGASRGIGRKVVEACLEAGYAVSAGLRDPTALAPRERLLAHRYEAESLDSARAWLDATVARFGRLDGLVNAAGINTMARLGGEDEAGFDRLWAVNVKGPLRLIRLALPQLRAAGQGRVINVASLSGKRVANENVGYAMSKFALIALTQAVRREGWDHGIRATALCPGWVATDMSQHASFPREQMTDPVDIAALAVTLLRLPNNASIGELLVGCRFEALL